MGRNFVNFREIYMLDLFLFVLVFVTVCFKKHFFSDLKPNIVLYTVFKVMSQYCGKQACLDCCLIQYCTLYLN